MGQWGCKESDMTEQLTPSLSLPINEMFKCKQGDYRTKTNLFRKWPPAMTLSQQSQTKAKAGVLLRAAG